MCISQEPPGQGNGSGFYHKSDGQHLESFNQEGWCGQFMVKDNSAW